MTEALIEAAVPPQWHIYPILNDRLEHSVGNYANNNVLDFLRGFCYSLRQVLIVVFIETIYRF